MLEWVVISTVFFFWKLRWDKKRKRKSWNFRMPFYYYYFIQQTIAHPLDWLIYFVVILSKKVNFFGKYFSFRTISQYVSFTSANRTTNLKHSGYPVALPEWATFFHVTSTQADATRHHPFVLLAVVSLNLGTSSTLATMHIICFYANVTFRAMFVRSSVFWGAGFANWTVRVVFENTFVAFLAVFVPFPGWKSDHAQGNVCEHSNWRSVLYRFATFAVLFVVRIIDLVVGHFHGRHLLSDVRFHKVWKNPERWQDLLNERVDMVVHLINCLNCICQQLGATSERRISKNTYSAWRPGNKMYRNI